MCCPAIGRRRFLCTRSKSGSTRFASSNRICWLTAPGVTPNSSAARCRFPWRAEHSNTLTKLSGGNRFIAAFLDSFPKQSREKIWLASRRTETYRRCNSATRCMNALRNRLLLCSNSLRRLEFDQPRRADAPRFNAFAKRHGWSQKGNQENADLLLHQHREPPIGTTEKPDCIGDYPR